MRLEKVKLADMRPDPNNPREDFGDLDAMMRSFEFNPVHPGEPLNPPVTVEDGNVYRIVDGERRFRAMMELKRETCHAIVCDDFDEADAIVAMMATDDKKQLSEVERSRGIQRMLKLDVNEDAIEEITSIPMKKVRHVRAGMKRAGEKAEQLTTDWLAAVGEAEERGDAEAAEAIMNAKVDDWHGSQWKSIKSKFDALRAHEAGFDTLRRACEELKVPFTDCEPKNAVFENGFYQLEEDDDERIRAWVQKQADKGLSIYCPAPTVTKAYVTPESFSTPGSLTEEEAKTKSTQNQAKSAMTNAKKRRAQWVGERIKDPDALEHTLQFFVDKRQLVNAREFSEKAGVEREEIPCPPSPFLLACDWSWTDNMTQAMLLAILFDRKDPSGAIGEQAMRSEADEFTDFLIALSDDGYEFDEHETELYKACCDILDEITETDDDA